ELWSWGQCLVATAVLIAARIALVRWAPLLSPAKLWTVGGVATFLLLAVGVQELLPAYHRRFALRGMVRRHAGAEAVVFCYPKRWDSVTFYLRRDVVAVYAAAERGTLMAELQARGHALGFVKTRHLEELRAALPGSLELTVCGRQGTTLTTVLVRPRDPQGGSKNLLTARRYSSARSDQ